MNALTCGDVEECRIMIFKLIALPNFLHTYTMTNVTKDSIKQFGVKKDNAKSNVSTRIGDYIDGGYDEDVDTETELSWLKII